MARRLAHIFGIPCLALSSAAFALGVGSIESNSALNQPLSARIPLISSDPHEVDNLTVSLASPVAFQRAGVERPFYLSQLKFEVVTDAPQPYVKVTTEDPFKEPFLDFLVELNWPQGRLVREYTLLLDPPLYETNQAAAPAPAAQPARPAQRIESAARAGGNGAVARPAPSGGSYTEVADAPSEYGPVRPNDTLWEIAQQVRPSGELTVQQTMVALLRANPDAFLNGDMNRLKRGAVLRVPPQSEIASITAAAARAEVSRQVALWRESQAQRQPVAEVAADNEPRLQVVAPPDDIEEGGEDSPTSLLERDLAATADNISRLQRELSMSEESRVGLQAENEELRGQVDDLKQQLAALERMVNLQLANATADEAADEAADMAPAELASAEEAAVEEPDVAGDSAAEAGAEETVEPVTEPAVATIETLEPTTVPAEVTAPVQPEQPDSRNFLSDWRNIGVLGGAALLVAALIMLLIRRRREAAEVAAMAAAEPAPIQETEEPAEAVARSESEPVDAEEELPDMMPEEDPLSEADIYMAHGHYDQARSVMESAIEQEPHRTDLRLKLLEIGALTLDRDVFDAQLVALHERAGDEHPDWQRALEFAREFAPEHPLVAGDVAEALEVPAADEAAPVEVDLGDAEPQAYDDVAVDASKASEPASFEAAAPQSSAEDLSLDFDLGEPVSGAAAEQVEAIAEERAGDDADLEFELDQALSVEPGLDEERPAAKQELDDLEFDLDGLDFAVEGDAASARDSADAKALEDAFELPALDDQDLGGDDGLGALDEVSTKLDLARAYLDMGDGEGARDLLQEVIDEGNASQRQEAESLLRDIA